MRWAYVVVVGILVLSSLASTVNASPKGVISCANSELASLPDNWSMADQTCVRVDLGIQKPGTTLFFEVSTNREIDILMFSANSVSVYQNEQSYRSTSIWQSESVFELFSGSGEWHWTVPSDREETRWYLVLDNREHPQDGGEGAQGGQSAEVSLDGGTVFPQQYTLSDSIHRVGVGGYAIAYGPFSVDDGTFVEIHARTMEGYPDIFVMTESAYSLYSPSVNWSAASRIVSADMLLVTNERYLPWEATNTNGEDIYVIVDNRPGPGGGGAGTAPAGVTVTITLTPVLDPTISSEPSLDSVDVGATITLSALDTPNKSNQIPESGFSWDIDGDGLADATGPTTSHSWDSPGNYTIRLSVMSVDSRSASSTREIQVQDISDPIVTIGAGGQILKGFGENIVLSGTFTDNWGVDSLDWLLDDVVIESNYSVTEPSSTLSFDISTDYAAGNHVISLRVNDRAGRSSQDDVTITIIDVTPPAIGTLQEELEVKVGVPTEFHLMAEDSESERLEYTWIFEQGTANEVQFSGPQVIYIFATVGPQYVVCQVENEAGLVSVAEMLVIVESEGDGQGGLGPFSIALIAVIVLLLLSLGGFVAFNLAVKRRVSNISEDEGADDPSSESSLKGAQVAMWGGSDESPFQPPSRQTIDMDTADQISVQYPLERAGLSPTEDDVLTGLTEEPEDSEPETIVDRKVRRECSSCSRPFDLELPEGIDSAYTNCPYCGSEELVSLG
jgi:DNA-directed RNA polymerase subunit RPC12/RpoP